MSAQVDTPTKYPRVVLATPLEIERVAFVQFFRERRLPFELHVVESAADVVARHKSKPFDLIIIDHQLDGGTGLDAIKDLDAPILLLVQPDGEEAAKRFVKGCPADFLIKDPQAGYFWQLPRFMRNAMDRKEAIETARQSDARTREILENAMDCIIAMDKSGKIVEFNHAAEKTFGYTREEVLGQPMDELLFPPKLQARAKRNVNEYSSSHEEGSMINKRLDVPAMRKNGEVFDAEFTMQPISWEGSTVFAVFLRDITARKQAQREIEIANRDLKMLLYVTSHDLREPLRTVESFSKLAMDELPEEAERPRSFLQRTINGAQRMNQLIEDVLMLAKARQSSEPTESVSLRDLTTEVTKMLAMRIRESGGEVLIDDNLPTLNVDRRWTQQAIFNLVGNALKFTREGESPIVEVRTYLPGPDDLEQEGIVVSDRGPGIPEAQVERIFELFQRAVGREYEGTGAGLAIVRQVAERHNGAVWYRAREGGGSEFVLTFGP